MLVARLANLSGRVAAAVSASRECSALCAGVETLGELALLASSLVLVHDAVAAALSILAMACERARRRRRQRRLPRAFLVRVDLAPNLAVARLRLTV